VRNSAGEAAYTGGPTRRRPSPTTGSRSTPSNATPTLPPTPAPSGDPSCRGGRRGPRPVGRHLRPL